MVSAMQQHGHCVRALHAPCSMLTRAVAALYDVVMQTAVDLLRTACRAQRW